MLTRWHQDKLGILALILINILGLNFIQIFYTSLIKSKAPQEKHINIDMVLGYFPTAWTLIRR